MKRFVVALIVFSFGSLASAQNVEQMRATAKYMASLQNPDGGFASAPGGKSSVTATVSAVRVLKYTGGSVPNLIMCLDYVAACQDPETGGFAPTPGGKPDIRTTALAMAGLGELKINTPERVEKSLAYVSKNAREFEDVRLTAGALEALDVTGPEVPRWSREILETRNEDGSFGKGESRAFETGSKVAALLRLKQPLDKREGAIAAILAGQRSDGGWSASAPTSDLGATYRVMRALFLLKAKPDLDRVRAFIASHANPDGSFASKPGAKDGGGTYSCSIINYWSRQLDGEPALIETTGFLPLFNGKDLSGWEGDAELWSAKDGKIVGVSPGIKRNQFLATKKSYGDFILQLSFRVRGDDSANSGVQFRSVRIPGTEMSGYQADIGQGYWGCLYDESRRNKVLAQASEQAKANVHTNDWNHYVIRAMGNQITLSLNGRTSVTYREQDDGVARVGKIALQIHSGNPLTVEFKDILIQPLPTLQTESARTEGFHLRSLKTASGERKYGLYLPKGFDPAKAYPVALFLHGSGERGTDGIAQSQIGLGAAIEANPARFPAIVVFPQARQTWAADSEDGKAAVEILDAVMKEFKCDPDRIALTGLSMGGAGTWGIAAKEPGRFSRIVPICGMGKVEIAPTIKHLPAWVLVGDEDRLATVQNGREMVRALKKAGGTPKYTEYRGVPHNSWDRAYNDAELVQWMFEQSKAGR